MTRSVDDLDAQRWQRLSALCDGEAGADEAQSSFEGWREDAQLRARWHAYQWIGDVMRSDDLATDADHDQAFLLALRARLASEPVVLAPARGTEQVVAPEPAAVGIPGGTRLRRQRWGAPAAMAAGVMVVAGALVVIRGTTALGEPPADLVAATASGAQPLVKVAVAPEPVASEAGVGEMLRNPELDRYLNAHRQFAQGATLATPGGVRQVAVTPEGR
ncbi:MAG: sigma-E factor negative regulatory protein [Pseudomonadota bacterium]